VKTVAVIAPSGVAITPNGSYAYVTSESYSGTIPSGGRVRVINTSTNKVVNTVKVGDSPSGIAITHSGSDAYVANSGSGTVSVINTSTNKVVKTVKVGSYPSGVAIT
jgi:YVTN family beta-propeller protein